MDTYGWNKEFVSTMLRFGKIQWDCIMCGLTKGEFGILQAIKQTGTEKGGKKGVYVSEFAAQLHMTLPNVSRMLKGLEEQGLVARELDSDNRRKTLVYLTKNGEGRCEQAQKEVAAFMEAMQKKMGREDMEEFMRLWNKLADVMTEILEENSEEER